MGINMECGDSNCGLIAPASKFVHGCPHCGAKGTPTDAGWKKSGYVQPITERRCFCGASSDKVIVIKLGGDAYICEHCVALCNEIIKEKKG